ncbi:tRNA (adenosine(37)-N6)-dimethylallyltransferase MiaA [Hydromonas duriensis]|uniref:tRNA dimethylallyltransferase n=1 Tax=Hydromonas duriensis TaxID=1527608 RepID=A0A4R6Y7S7_9BURK|nr:tRNA (adenosine(37)-N6)-dimethylallyltransferase MiaA [Hydromonas duriensis]TDR31410.1 tRNA dimethylallyltransferase [Hydromonas duriensis]
MSTSTQPKALFILGPTASGKTAAALELARLMPIEIISVDSALVFKGMNIGTAKPSATEQACAPHHLIDIIEPTEAYSAAQFAQDASRLIQEIDARGRVPVLVGGTMLYVKALLEPLTQLPSADAAFRQHIDQRAAAIGWPALHDELAQIDAITAARLFPNDAQRISRALEIYHLTGRPMSAVIAEQGDNKADLPFTPILTALIPEPRALLHERINARFTQMLAHGFLDEMHTLRARGDLNPNMTSMRCVGYRQAWAHLDGEYGLDELIEKGQAATRQLAKRQLTWLRSMKELHVFENAESLIMYLNI